MISPKWRAFLQAKVSLIAIATQMVAEPRPESSIKNSVDNKKITCVLVDKNVKVKKKKQSQFGDLCLA